MANSPECNGHTDKRDRMARVMLWSCPRSLSTAFVRSILELGTVEVFNEEYATAFYFGPERVADPRFRLNLAPSHRYAAVKERLEADYPGKLGVFGKDFAYPILDRGLDNLPEGFYHTFLVRSPTKVFVSLKPRFESSRLLTTCGAPSDMATCMPITGYTYRELRELYDLVRGLGLPTLVIDADDLLENPVGMMRRYCQTTGLPFAESMVHWQPAKFGDMQWHCSRALRLTNWMMGWYEGALKSSGFRKPAPRHIDVESLAPDIKLAIETSQPHYDYLFSQRTTLDSLDKSLE